MKRILIIDQGGIQRIDTRIYDFENEAFLMDQTLFSGMLSAINSLAIELGGLIQIVVLGGEKFTSRYINCGDYQFLMLISDTYNTRDDYLLLKSEIFYRIFNPLLQPYSGVLISKMNPFDLIFSQIDMILDQKSLESILKSKKIKFLLKTLNRLENPHKNFEDFLNHLAKEIPIEAVFFDPSLIVLDNRKIIVPSDFKIEFQRRIFRLIETRIRPLLGDNYLDNLMKKFKIHPV